MKIILLNLNEDTHPININAASFRCSKTSPVIHPNDRRGVWAGREQYVKDGSPKQPATLKFCVIYLNNVDFVISFNP